MKDEKLTIAEAIKKEEPQLIYEAIAYHMNSYGIPFDEIIKEIEFDKEVSEHFLELSAWWINECSVMCERKYMYDKRNQYTVLFAVKYLYPLDIIQNTLVHGDEFTECARKTAEYIPRRMHRTLQQSFGSLVFRYLKSRQSERRFSEIRHLSKSMPDWERAPLI